MSLMYLHLAHRAELSALRVKRLSTPSPETEANQAHRRTRATQYFELARDHITRAATLSPQDPLWRQVTDLMDRQYDS